MNKNNLISIIMPVYNSRFFLKESIDSVLKQTYKNWELICIDDGSTDDSLIILKQYAKEYFNINVYTQNNSGPAQARKIGFQNSNGNFITLLDSDDKISPDNLEEMLKVALDTQADIVMPILISNYTSKNEFNFNNKHNIKINEEIAPRAAFLRTFPWSVHGLNLYKSNYLKKYALTDISNINNYNADEYLTRILLLNANKIVTSKGKYYYRANPSSITNTFSGRKFGVLLTNKLLYDLAVRNHFDIYQLSIISEFNLNTLFSLKIQLVCNKKNLDMDNFNKLYQIVEKEKKEKYFKTLKITNFKLLLKFVFIYTNKEISYYFIKMYKLLKGNLCKNTQ